jgi:hypothetical protein
MTRADRPSVSIILIIGKQRDRARIALDSILAQDRIDEAEVILLDVALDVCPPLSQASHPAVRLVQVGRDRHIGEMRAYGVHLAQAPLVAFLEEHAFALPGWLAATLDAFAEGPWSVVGPALWLGKDDSALSLALISVGFASWMAPSATREVKTVIGHDSAYRREALLLFADELDDLLMAEQVLHARLVERGHRLLLCGEAVIYHRNESTLSAMMFDYFFWNINFGALRIRDKGKAERLMRMMATPLVPIARTWRAWPVLRRYAQGSRLILTTVYAFLCCVAQAAGLLVGYLGRSRGAALRLSRAELETPYRDQLPTELR